jgi:hypothetical protein
MANIFKDPSTATRCGWDSRAPLENIISDCMHAARANLLTFPLMNILIENADSLEYLTNANLWTKKAAEGKNFGATGTAFEAAKKELIGRFNIVAYIPETRQFVNLDHGRGKGVAEAGAV